MRQGTVYQVKDWVAPALNGHSHFALPVLSVSTSARH